jgi:transposase
MSNFVLYHGLGIRGYEHVRADDSGGRLVFTIRQRREALRCSHCGSARVFSKGQVEREWRSVPLGGKPVVVRLAVPRVLCLDCGLTRQVRISFADEKVRYTKGFARYALGLSRHMTIQAVAEHLGISWDVIKQIQKQHLQRHYAKPRLKHLRRIAIDEISIGKGHKYLTIVLDLESGAVVFQGDGRGSEALLPFWKRLRSSGAKVQAVAIDMSPAYWRAVRENLPKALVIFDHFHIIKLFNHELSELRRELYREATDKLEKKVLKGTRWLLLKNPENLDRTKREPHRLREALKLNESLAAGYYLKEKLRQLWNEPDKRCAAAALDVWILEAEYSGVRRLMKLARTMQIHRRGILAWYDHPITTGPLEGTNNKIKTMKRQAYGYRDLQFLKLKIFAIHEAQYALVG